MFSFRDVVYNKATDDFTVSVKDLKRDIVMDGERLVIVNLISLQPLLLLHDQDDDDHHHYPQVRLRGGRLRPLLGAQRAHLPWRREVPRQGSSCPRLQVSFIEPLSLSSSSQLSSFPSHLYHFCISTTNIQPPGMPQSLLESDFFWLAQAILQKTSLFNVSSNPIDYNSDDRISFCVAHMLLKQRY